MLAVRVNAIGEINAFRNDTRWMGWLISDVNSYVTGGYFANPIGFTLTTVRASWFGTTHPLSTTGGVIAPIVREEYDAIQEAVTKYRFCP